MTAVDLTVIDRGSSAGLNHSLAARLIDAVVSLDRDHAAGAGTRSVVVAVAVRPAAARQHGPNRRVAGLDYAAWHAHLAGIRRWVPGGAGGTTP